MHRKKIFLFVLVVAVGISAPLAQTYGQQTKPPGAARGGPASKTTDTFDVLKVGDDYQVVAKSDLNGFKKRIADEYNVEMKKYLEAKKDKSNTDSHLTKPVKKTVTVVKSNLKNQDEAKDYIDKLRENGAGKKVD